MIIDGFAPAVPTETPLTGATSGTDLGKEEFLKLLVAQLRNQDPMNPSRPEEMASQLAQFSSLEQLINVNTLLTEQTASYATMALALNNSAAIGVLGKDVLAVGDTVSVTGTAGDTITVGVEKGGEATLILYDASGVRVGAREVGPVGAGRQDIELGDAAVALEPGDYRYELVVRGVDGEQLEVQTFTRARIDGLRYGPQGPLLLAGTLEIPLSNIVEILA